MSPASHVFPALQLDEKLDLDTADVIYRGAPRAVTAVGGHGQAVELGLRVRHVSADETVEVGEALAVEQLAQLLERRRTPQRVHEVTQDLEWQAVGPDDLRRALSRQDRRGWWPPR